MSRQTELAQHYQCCRPRLLRIAYAIVGTHADAEDVVADCWVRLVAADERDQILDVEAWAVTAVARLALDLLRSARRRREHYVGPWLPEPDVAERPPIGNDPVDHTVLREAVSFALMVALETLTPAERTAWVLHDVFAIPFTEIAETVGRTPQAVRQLARRARQRLEKHAAIDTSVLHGEDDHLASEFIRAARSGDTTRLTTLLDPSIVVTSDGGGRVVAARKPVSGRVRAIQFLMGIAGWIGSDQQLVPVTVNGGPGFVMLTGTTPTAVCALTVKGSQITRIDFVLAPDKLQHLPQLPFSQEGRIA